MPAVKVLLAGDVQGKLDALFKRVATVNNSNGPFNLLLCAGAFFPPGGRTMIAARTLGRCSHAPIMPSMLSERWAAPTSRPGARLNASTPYHQY